MSSSNSNNHEKRFVCLICKNNIPKNGIINHVAEHINYKRHKCSRCSFKCVLMEAIVDHQNQTGHKVEIDAHKNWYMERICQMIYCDFDYADKHGEEVIRKTGPVFADRDRLLEMLKAEEMKQEHEILTIEEAMETEQPEQHQQFNSSMVSSSIFPEKNKRVNVAYNQQEWLDPNPGCSHQSRPLQRINSKPSTTPTVRMEQQSSCRPLEQQSSHRPPAVIAAADSSFCNDNLDTGRLLADIQQQITKGVDKKQCKMCKRVVLNDYASQKKHVLEWHKSAIPFQQDHHHFAPVLAKCFKHEGGMFIQNDFQCNICGKEIKYKGTRYHHVSAQHTDLRWNCFFTGCNYELRSFTDFGHHMNNFHHKKSHELEKDEKDQYIRFKAEFELKLTPLVRKCFPYDLPTAGGGKRTADEDALIDEITTNIMPTRVIPEKLAPQRIRSINNFEQISSDDSSSDEEMKPEKAENSTNTKNRSEHTSNQQRNIQHKNGNQQQQMESRKNQLPRPNFEHPRHKRPKNSWYK